MALTNAPDAAPGCVASKPRLSVIIPVHNVVPTLAETMDSLFAQTEPGWEALIVDDGSTDETPQLIAELKARDARIRSLTLGKQGVSKAMNAGIAAARADHVMILDGDDWLAPHYIERMFRALAEHPSADIPYCGFYRVPVEGWALPVEFVPEIEKRPFEALSTRCAFASHCVVLPRQLLLDLGGFDTSLITSEDWDLWLRIARTGATFVGVPEGLAYYRARPGSATSRYLQMIADLKEVMAHAQAPDPRVKNPHPRYSEGVRIREPELRVLAGALLLAGVECVNGRPGAPALDPLEPLPNCETILEDNCNSLLQGLMFTRPAFAVADVWTRLEPHLLGVCERIARASPGVDARAMLRRIACRVLERCDLKAPRRLGAIWAQELHLDGTLPAIALPDGIEHVYFRLLYGGKRLEDICLAGRGSLSALALRHMVLEALGLDQHPKASAWRAWLSLPFRFAAKSMQSIRQVLRSKQDRKARLLQIAGRLSHSFAASVHLLSAEDARS
jgi:glycosyltransferase involved in cell wall biosynthesis